MEFINGYLTTAKQIVIPLTNYERNKPNTVAVVVHSTEASYPESTIAWFKNPLSRVSAHFLIARDGRIWQFVSINDVAYHSGTFMNWHSIGIELDNLGPIKTEPTMPYVTAAHWKNNKIKNWEYYPDVQIDVLNELLDAIVNTVGYVDIVGHDMLQNDKSDPGPAFPYCKIKRYDSEIPVVIQPSPSEYKIKNGVMANVREKADPKAPFVKGSPLPMNSPVKLRNTTIVNGYKEITSPIQGWVWGEYVVKT